MMIELKERTERLYTADEAASVLRINRRKVIAMGAAGEIELVKLGPRTFRYTARSLQRWLKPRRNRRNAGEAAP